MYKDAYFDRKEPCFKSNEIINRLPSSSVVCFLALYLKKFFNDHDTESIYPSIHTFINPSIHPAVHSLGTIRYKKKVLWRFHPSDKKHYGSITIFYKNVILTVLSYESEA